MLTFETTLVLIGGAILAIGMFYSIKIVWILKNENLYTPWVMLSLLISFFLIGYAFMAIRFGGFEFLPSLTDETIVALVFFVGAIIVSVVTYLNRKLFIDIFGLELAEKEAVRKFLTYIKNPENIAKINLFQKYSVVCDTCNDDIVYSIPDIVRSHPRLERGIRVEEAMGSKSYTFFIRHRCNGERREIPVLHDSKFEYRSQRPSRII